MWLIANPPAAVAPSQTYLAPDGVRPRSTSSPVFTPMAGISRALGVDRARTTTDVGAAEPWTWADPDAVGPEGVLPHPAAAARSSTATTRGARRDSRPSGI